MPMQAGWTELAAWGGAECHTQPVTGGIAFGGSALHPRQ
jgi:hypothetical protein